MSKRRLWRARLRNLFAGLAVLSFLVFLSVFLVALVLPGGDDWWFNPFIGSWVVCAISTILSGLTATSGEPGETSDW